MKPTSLAILVAAAVFHPTSLSAATGTNWILQKRLSLTMGAWTNSPSGPANPVTVPATPPTKFYRLFKP